MLILPVCSLLKLHARQQSGLRWHVHDQGGIMAEVASAVVSSAFALFACEADFLFFLLGPVSGIPQSFIFQPSSRGMEFISALSLAKRSAFNRWFSVMSFIFGSRRGATGAGAGSFLYCKMRSRSLGSRTALLASISASAFSSFSSKAFAGEDTRPATRPAVTARLRTDVQLAYQPDQGSELCSARLPKLVRKSKPSSLATFERLFE
eukprot:UN0886